MFNPTTPQGMMNTLLIDAPLDYHTTKDSNYNRVQKDLPPEVVLGLMGTLLILFTVFVIWDSLKSKRR